MWREKWLTSDATNSEDRNFVSFLEDAYRFSTNETRQEENHTTDCIRSCDFWNSSVPSTWSWESPTFSISDISFRTINESLVDVDTSTWTYSGLWIIAIWAKLRWISVNRVFRYFKVSLDQLTKNFRFRVTTRYNIHQFFIKRWR